MNMGNLQVMMKGMFSNTLSRIFMNILGKKSETQSHQLYHYLADALSK